MSQTQINILYRKFTGRNWATQCVTIARVGDYLNSIKNDLKVFKGGKDKSCKNRDLGPKILFGLWNEKYGKSSRKSMSIRRFCSRRVFFIVILAFIIFGLGWGIYRYKRILDRQAAMDAMAIDGAKWPSLRSPKKTIWEILGEIFWGGQTSARAALDDRIEFSGQCSDSTLGHLADFDGSKIQSVLIEKCRVTGKGLAHLRYLPNLNFILIADCPLGDSGLKHLLDLPQIDGLWNLYLIDIPLKEEDFQIIGKLSELRVLGIEGIGVSEESLEQLAGLKKLDYLSLKNGSLPVESVEPLPCMPELTIIDLRYAKITDATLRLFIKQQKLKDMILYGTDVTEKGLNEFHVILPNVELLEKVIDGQSKDFVPNSVQQHREDPSANKP